METRPLPLPLMESYLIGDDGSVWRTEDVALVRAAVWPDRNGYLYFRRRPSRQKTLYVYVHKAVALAFHGAPPFERSQARHLNGDRRDNRASNIAWGTHAMNMADRDSHGMTHRGEAINTAKLREPDVVAAREAHSRGESIGSLSRRFGVSHSAMACVVRRQTWRHVA